LKNHPLRAQGSDGVVSHIEDSACLSGALASGAHCQISKDRLTLTWAFFVTYFTTGPWTIVRRRVVARAGAMRRQKAGNPSEEGFPGRLKKINPINCAT
jgi:hypothetical protein